MALDVDLSSDDSDRCIVPRRLHDAVKLSKKVTGSPYELGAAFVDLTIEKHLDETGEVGNGKSREDPIQIGGALKKGEVGPSFVDLCSEYRSDSTFNLNDVGFMYSSS